MDKKFKIPTVALIGRPNVGKSTLFNRITKSRDALVDPTPGLTRDIRKTTVSWNDFIFDLVDTGGLDPPDSKDPIGKIVHSKSVEALRQSDLLLFLVDAKQGLTPSDMEIYQLCLRNQIPYMVVVNKVDSPSQEADCNEFFSLGIDKFYPISAEHGRGVKGLLDEIVAHFKKHGFETAPLHEMEPEEETEPFHIKVALIGRPNAGKSSLLNRLAGQQRMIVTDIPGTTRDAIDTLLQRPGHPDIVLTDTAGIRRKSRVRDKIEKFSVLKALEAIKKCDIALVVLDASEGVTDQDKKLIGYTEEFSKACITIFNKWDLVQKDPKLIKLRTEELRLAKRFVPYSPHLNISALTGKRVDRILPLVEDIFSQLNTRINTGKANQLLNQALSVRTPPIAKGHHLKLYYTTQVSVNPPSFLIFANYPDYIPDHYKRFLVNQFRERLELEHVPIRIFFRKRERRD